VRRLLYLFILIGLYLTSTGQAVPVRIAALRSKPPVSARLAAEKPRLPTFDDVHERFTAIVLNESGWKSKPDIIGIGGVLVSRGGGRKAWRNYRGSGYGIDYKRFLTYAARASLKIFPVDDPWAFPVMVARYNRKGAAAREHHIRRQKRAGNSYWTSTFNLNCSEPKHWAESHDVPWKNYEDRCDILTAKTRGFLEGDHPKWCRTFTGEPAIPQFWGCELDVPRAEAQGWEELTCNEPDADCTGFDWRKDPNNVSCARNRFFRHPTK